MKTTVEGRGRLSAECAFSSVRALAQGLGSGENQHLLKEKEVVTPAHAQPDLMKVSLGQPRTPLVPLLPDTLPTLDPVPSIWDLKCF